MLSFPFANLQVVERERVDSKAEQEKLNMNIQEFLKEMEVLCWGFDSSLFLQTCTFVGRNVVRINLFSFHEN